MDLSQRTQFCQYLLYFSKILFQSKNLVFELDLKYELHDDLSTNHPKKAGVLFEGVFSLWVPLKPILWQSLETISIYESSFVVPAFTLKL